MQVEGEINLKCKVQPDLSTVGIEVKNVLNKGRGVFATLSFKRGDLIFEESPLIGCQFAWNEEYGYCACSYCLRPLETAEQNVRRLCQDSSIELPFPHLSGTRTAFHKICECGARYCSQECQQSAFIEYHAVLCAPPGGEKASLIEKVKEVWKKFHYPPETATILLILRMYAYVHQSNDKEAAVRLFQDFVSETCSRNGEECHKLVGPKFTKNISVLRENLMRVVECLGLDIPFTWKSSEAFITALALIGTNGQGIGTSAFSEWVKNFENCPSLSSDERTTLDCLINDLYIKMDEVVGMDFLNNEGSGLYSLQSKINHSCEPNVEISFPNGNHTLAVIALRDIAVGEEICSSYLDECALARSRHSRQAILRCNYLFLCLCSKCEGQAADPDISSDESED